MNKRQRKKRYKKMYENKIITIDWSNTKDYSVQTTTKINGDKIEIIKTETI